MRHSICLSQVHNKSSHRWQIWSNGLGGIWKNGFSLLTGKRLVLQKKHKNTEMFKIQLHTNHSLIIFSWELYLSLHIRVFILVDKLGFGAPTTFRLFRLFGRNWKTVRDRESGITPFFLKLKSSYWVWSPGLQPPALSHGTNTDGLLVSAVWGPSWVFVHLELLHCNFQTKPTVNIHFKS